MYKIESHEEEEKIIDGAELKERIIKPDIPIHGILLNEYCESAGFVIVALETKDN